MIAAARVLLRILVEVALIPFALLYIFSHILRAIVVLLFVLLRSCRRSIALLGLARRARAWEARQRAADEFPVRQQTFRLAFIIGEPIPRRVVRTLARAPTSGELRDQIRRFDIELDFHALRLRSAMSLADQRRIGRVPRVYLPVKELNAVAVNDPSLGGYMIAVNMWVRIFLTYANNLWPYPILSQAASCDPGQLASFRSGLPGLIAIFLETIDGDMRDAPEPPTEDVGGMGLRYVSKRLFRMTGAYFQLRFILAHEYAHVLLGHLKMREKSHHALADGKILPFFSRSWEQEFEADRLGAGLLYDSLAYRAIGFRTYDRAIERACYTAPVMFFSFLDLLYSVVEIPAASSTHPPPELRIAALRRWMMAYVPREQLRWCEAVIDQTRLLKTEVGEA